MDLNSSLKYAAKNWWFFAAAGIVLAGTIVEGYWSLRWGTRGEWRLDPLAQSVKDTPLMVGEWTADQTVEPDPRVLDISGAHALFQATYREETRGDYVTVYLVTGWSRDVSVHTPDACYPGAGFVMETSPQLFTLPYETNPAENNESGVGLRQAELTTAIFTKTEPTGVTRVRVFWSWNNGRGWQSPRFPRWAFGGRRPLVKLYLVADSPPGLPTHESAALRLATVLLPILDRRLEAAFITGPPHQKSES
ncbi:MAG: exosortase-associated EpsI family protein [Thermogutta sp.]